MKIEHVAMYVEDLEKARAFFETYFQGCPNTLYHNPKTGFRSYFLTFDDGARLELMQRPDTEAIHTSPLRRGFIHLAMSVGSREAVDALTERLKKDGYDILSGPRTTGDGYYESCVAGIEGNLIEITI